MGKEMIKKFLWYIGAIMILFPILINVLMFIHIFPVSGDENSWISSLGTFWGAIIGGVISGTLTLIGVNATIKASTEGISKTINEQSRIREQEIILRTSKERLFNFYHPIDVLHSEFVYQYGAHQFTDLNEEQQSQFLSLLNKNIIYADSVMFNKFYEMQWGSIELNKERVNKNYDEINDLITEEIIKLREILKLPVLYFYKEDI